MDPESIEKEAMEKSKGMQTVSALYELSRYSVSVCMCLCMYVCVRVSVPPTKHDDKPYHLIIVIIINRLTIVIIIVDVVVSLFTISIIHFGHFYSTPSSLLLLRGAPDYSTDTVSEKHTSNCR